MTIPVTGINHLRVLLQINESLTIMQRDMRNNATNWRQLAVGETVPLAELELHMNTATATWQGRLDDISDFQTNNPIEFPNVVTMYEVLGGTTQDFNNTTGPMQTVVTQMNAAPKTTYGELISICDSILSLINAPLTIWDE